jgi:hypothetical protein
MEDKWELYDQVDNACRGYLAASSKLRKLSKKPHKHSKEVMSTALAKQILALHALKEAVELTPGDWDDNDLEVSLAALRGEVNLVDLWEKQAKEEQMLKMLETAVIYDEDENILQTPDGEAFMEPGYHGFTVLKAWKDEDGQLRVIVRRLEDDE